MSMFGWEGYFGGAEGCNLPLAPMWSRRRASSVPSRPIKYSEGSTGIPADIEAIKECILRLSQMVSDHPEIKELDINPLIVYPEGQGCMVADSRLLLSGQEG